MQGIRKVMAWLVVPFTAAIIGMAVLASSPAHAASVHPAASVSGSFTGYIMSGALDNECLDNSNFRFANTNPLQIWKCGAAGGSDQQFNYNGTSLTITQPDTTNVFCVTDAGVSGDAYTLRLNGCSSGDTHEAVSYDSATHQFSFGDGKVFDVFKQLTANGTPVGAFNSNGGANQTWSLPF